MNENLKLAQLITVCVRYQVEESVSSVAHYVTVCVLCVLTVCDKLTVCMLHTPVCHLHYQGFLSQISVKGG